MYEKGPSILFTMYSLIFSFHNQILAAYGVAGTNAGDTKMNQKTRSHRKQAEWCLFGAKTVFHVRGAPLTLGSQERFFEAHSVEKWRMSMGIARKGNRIGFGGEESSWVEEEQVQGQGEGKAMG